MNYLFVGEERSNLAIKMNVTWKDGRLAAKQLFDALKFNHINPDEQHFTNIFEDGGEAVIKSYTGTIVAMGRKVEKRLKELNIEHLFIFHPATRGSIRKKENYFNHIKEQLLN